MPIQVSCSACAGKYRVPDNVAGKKIRCPKCKEVIQVPAAADDAAKPTIPASQPAAQSKSAAPKTPAAAPKPAKPAVENWYLKTEDGESYGPVPRAELDSWYAEGRVTTECQLLREGSDQWQWASELYPELDAASAASAAPSTSDVAAASEEEPAAAEKPAASAPAKEEKEEAASPTSFSPPEEPAAEASSAADSGDDNPFAFLGGSGGSSGGAGGGDAFNFSASPSSSASPTSAKAKPTKKAASASAPAAADAGEVSDKSKLTAGLLAIFLGAFGVHRFYLGYTTLGIVQLLLCGGCGIWQIIDIVMIFMGKLPDAQGKPLKG